MWYNRLVGAGSTTWFRSSCPLPLGRVNYNSRQTTRTEAGRLWPITTVVTANSLAAFVKGRGRRRERRWGRSSACNSSNNLSSLTFHPTKQLNHDATHGWRGFSCPLLQINTHFYIMATNTNNPIYKRVLKTKHSEVPQRNGTPLNIIFSLPPLSIFINCKSSYRPEKLEMLF